MYKQKMYSIVLRHLSGIQKGIQHGHSKDSYEEKFSDDKEYKQWLRKDKTVVVLQCNSCKEVIEAAQNLVDRNIKCEIFYEEDLNNIPTSVSFLVDERVWDFEKYPNCYFKLNKTLSKNEIDELQYEANFKKYGKQVAFLKQFTRQFLLASN